MEQVLDHEQLDAREIYAVIAGFICGFLGTVVGDFLLTRFRWWVYFLYGLEILVVSIAISIMIPEAFGSQDFEKKVNVFAGLWYLMFCVVQVLGYERKRVSKVPGVTWRPPPWGKALAFVTLEGVLVAGCGLLVMTIRAWTLLLLALYFVARLLWNSDRALARVVACTAAAVGIAVVTVLLPSSGDAWSLIPLGLIFSGWALWELNTMRLRGWPRFA